MKPIRLVCLLLPALLCTSGPLSAQLLQVDPVLPTPADSVTIRYDATKGNGELTGISPVYAHAGIITQNSTSPTDWKYVQGTWGTADPKVLMTALGNNVHRIGYRIRPFYSNFPATDTLKRLAFVFRNQDGSKVGRSPDGSDIFYPAHDKPGLGARIASPENGSIYEPGASIPVRAGASASATLSLASNGSVISSGSGRNLISTLAAGAAGTYTLKFTAVAGAETKTDSITYTVRGPVTVQDPPAGIVEGINYLNDTTVILALYAPGKQYVYVLGDFNGWIPGTEHYMKKSSDGTLWWTEVRGLTPQQEYAFQYFVDGALRIADPYADKVLDPSNDPFIPASTYPNLKPYPTGLASGIVSVLQTARTPYVWQHPQYTRPANGDLVVYELLVRDFIAAHDYKTLIDTLDYLQYLGVNAIELMPVMEFEGNISWGYNPSFFFAPDKYYGTGDALKAFIDSCHGRGMVVILDMVLNHAFGQSPLVQLYWNPATSSPAANSPWFNPAATHPFNVGYDFNHESPQTKRLVDRVLKYWVTEYKFDGYRMDLSKGFTQTNYGGDVNAWSQYDAGRIALIKRMYDVLKQTDPDVYFILEHFAANNEEKELADYGMMLWGNMVGSYSAGIRGVASNFDWISYKSRNWQQPHVVGYLESHDEERLMVHALNSGSSGPNGYNVRNLNTALSRLETAGAFFFTIPGPKMFWQFGELGYDVSIDFNGRTGPKPIRWTYLNNPSRRRVYEVWSSLINLRNSQPVFSTSDFTLAVANPYKRIHLNHSSMNVTVLGNFDVRTASAAANFQHTGWWYEYFSRDSINVTDVAQQISLAPGEYRLYTDVRLSRPAFAVSTDPSETSLQGVRLYPNPSQGISTVEFELAEQGAVRVTLHDLSGKLIRTVAEAPVRPAGLYESEVDASGLPAGMYLLRVQAGAAETTLRLAVSH
ncbi:MAG: alpha-amylase family glycosyl hydrolase [Bacteroidia bacterium]|nr:alpha-amylase family glycosyl hydrolase [Bacteroidia bacterium]